MKKQTKSSPLKMAHNNNYNQTVSRLSLDMGIAAAAAALTINAPGAPVTNISSSWTQRP